MRPDASHQLLEKSFENRLEFRLQAVSPGHFARPPEGGTTNIG